MAYLETPSHREIRSIKMTHKNDAFDDYEMKYDSYLFPRWCSKILSEELDKNF